MRFLKLPCVIPIALLGCLAIGCNENGMPVGGQYVSPESQTKDNKPDDDQVGNGHFVNDRKRDDGDNDRIENRRKLSDESGWGKNRRMPSDNMPSKRRRTGSSRRMPSDSMPSKTSRWGKDRKLPSDSKTWGKGRVMPSDRMKRRSLRR